MGCELKSPPVSRVGAQSFLRILKCGIRGRDESIQRLFTDRFS